MLQTTSSRFSEGWIKPDLQENQLSKYHYIVKGLDNFQMGERVDIGAFTYIQADGGVIIEDDVQIGGGCKIYSVSTIDDKKGQVILKRNCRIGANSVIMPGITVGENAIVGALTFLNIDVPANTTFYKSNEEYFAKNNTFK